MASIPSTIPVSESPGAARPVGYHGAVSEFKRRLIEATLHQVRGNRTHAARALGLQRTYLLRLIRDLGITVPPPPRVTSWGASKGPTDVMGAQKAPKPPTLGA